MAEQINNIESCDHVQLGGQAFFDERKYFLFSPDPSTSSGQVQAGVVQKFRGLGMAQQMPDGTFDFVRKPQLKAKSKLIKKLAHGRASETKDGAIQLTLKVFRSEGLNISETIRMEANEAADAIREWQKTPSIPLKGEEGLVPVCENYFNHCNIQNLPIGCREANALGAGEMSEGQRGSK